MIRILLSICIFFLFLKASIYSQERSNNIFFSTDTITSSIHSSVTEPEDIYLSIKYLGVVDTTVAVIYYNENIFLPLRTLLQIFIIPFSEENKTISFTNPANLRVELNSENGEVAIGDTIILLTKENTFQRFDDIYLMNKILEKLFNIKAIFNFNNLSIKIECSEYLPIYKEYLREQNYRFLKTGEKFPGPLIYPLKKEWVAGGVLDYQVSSFYSRNISPYYSYQFSLGGEIAGGELRADMNGSYINNSNNVDNINYIWNYILNNNYLTRISLGDQIISGINSYSVRTLTFTNEPVTPRRIYNKIYLNGNASPFSTVEFYVDNKLSDFIHTGENGNYNFSLPLTYGTTLTKIISYDKEGNIFETNRLFQIPIDFLPDGELNYKFSFGRQSGTKNIFTLASASMGITDRLTNTTGIEYLQNSNNKNPVLFNSLKARFFSNLIMNIVLAPGVSYSTNLSSLSPDLKSFNIQLRKYENNLFYNPTKIKNEASANIYVPFRIKYLLNFSVSGKYTDFETTNSYDYKIESDGSFGNFHPIISYSRVFIKNAYTRSLVEGGFLFSVPQITKVTSLFQGNLLSLKANYNVSTRKFESLYLTFATTFYNYSRFQLSYINNFLGSSGSFQLQFITELPFTRSTTVASENNFSQSFQGSINYDMPDNRFYFYNRTNSGKASAVINMFVDENNNGKYEPGESKINNGRIILEGSSSVSNDNGYLYFNELTPYTKYSLTVDENSIQNPLLKPTLKNFSFIAAPNKVTQIDIPFYIAGEISGTVISELGKRNINLGSIQIFAEDSSGIITKIRTFEDGSYYYFGLRPGSYKVYINPEQITGIKTIPKEYNLNINPANNKNFISNVLFELK